MLSHSGGFGDGPLLSMRSGTSQYAPDTIDSTYTAKTRLGGGRARLLPERPGAPENDHGWGFPPVPLGLMPHARGALGQSPML